VFSRLCLEEIYAGFAQGHCDLDVVFLEYTSSSGAGRKSSTTRSFPIGSSVYLTLLFINPLASTPVSGANDANHTFTISEADR
jgi:hypothetical protein